MLVNSGEQSYTTIGGETGTWNVITRYAIRSLMKPTTEKREPTITYSGIIPGEKPEQIDIEQGLQELGQVCAGLVDVEDALEVWGVPKSVLQDYGSK